MLKNIMSIDPGKSTGVAFGTYSDTEPYRLVDAFQIPGGMRGFYEWLTTEHFTELDEDYVVVSEKFVLRSSNKFVADLEPVMIEGLMYALWGDRIAYQQRSDKALIGDRILKEHGLWQTGSQHGWVDGRDANDAIIHAIAYLFKTHHKPTLKYFFKPKEDPCGNN